MYATKDKSLLESMVGADHFTTHFLDLCYDGQRPRWQSGGLLPTPYRIASGARYSPYMAGIHYCTLHHNAKALAKQNHSLANRFQFPSPEFSSLLKDIKPHVRYWTQKFTRQQGRANQYTSASTTTTLQPAFVEHFPWIGSVLWTDLYF